MNNEVREKREERKGKEREREFSLGNDRFASLSLFFFSFGGLTRDFEFVEVKVMEILLKIFSGGGEIWKISLDRCNVF